MFLILRGLSKSLEKKIFKIMKRSNNSQMEHLAFRIHKNHYNDKID